MYGVCRSVVTKVGKKTEEGWHALWVKKQRRVGVHCTLVSSLLSDVLCQALKEDSGLCLWKLAGVMSCTSSWSQGNWVLGLFLFSSATLGSHCTFRGPQLSHL